MKLTQHWMGALIVCVVLMAGGCRSTPITPPVPQAADDSRLRRLAEDGREQFAEGDVDSAIKNYRKAIRRGWALDDPAEIGTIAFNLAATLLSIGETNEARDWLIESRSELTRAGKSVGNTWLLEAKIARSEGRVTDAQSYIALAECASAPCEVDNVDGACCHGGDPCEKKTCGACLPCVGDKLNEEERKKRCVTAYEAQILLAKAHIANDFGDVVQATALLRCARQTIENSCQRDLRSEIENVAGHIHLNREEPLQAAVHFDREADALRQAGNLRQIPYALQLAANAYVDGGRLDLAANRWCRAARVFHGRGDQKQAWQCVTSAIQTVTGVYIAHPAIANPVVVGETGFDSESECWNTDLVDTDLISFHDCGDTTNVTERRLAIIAREIKRVLDADQ
jgi:tetratricopeptide (TPR) repeat protein